MPNISRSNKGVLLCGGTGTRLRPATRNINKHLIPILNVPMVLYPLRTLKYCGCTDIILIAGGEHIGGFAEFLGDGSEYGMQITYRVQKEAGGIAQALALAEPFYRSAGQAGQVVVILGDNIFELPLLYSSYTGLARITAESIQGADDAVLLLKPVPDPERFGVAEIFDGRTVGHVTQIIEKPTKPETNLAVTGLYSYPVDVFDLIPTLRPSSRGELEITDVNNHYIKQNRCIGYVLNTFWSDAGIPKSLYEATNWAYQHPWKFET